MTEIRNLLQHDLPHLKEVIDSCNLFPSELLDDMLNDYLTNAQTNDIWLTLLVEQTPVGVLYCAPERMTEGTSNLYLIAVHNKIQGIGLGTQFMNYLENILTLQAVRVLIVETSGLEEFEQTRRFYDKCNYHREAVIRDFYKEGESKVVFWKKLQP